MSALQHHVDDYLRLRRALGYDLEETGRLLAKSTAGLTASLLDTLRDARLLLLARRMARNAPAR